MMGINHRDFHTHVIAPVCEYVALNCGVPNTPTARDLILVTAACETQMGAILPPGGITRIDEATFRELLRNYIENGPRFFGAMETFFPHDPSGWDDLAWNLAGSVLLTRLIYHRAKADTEPPPQPPSEYIDHLWMCYSRVWVKQDQDAFRLYLPLTGII
jgi:hypothetical protein